MWRACQVLAADLHDPAADQKHKGLSFEYKWKK